MRRLAVLALLAGCAPNIAGGQERAFKIINRCEVAVEWNSTTRSDWSGTIGPNSVVRLYPSAAQLSETITFKFPSGRTAQVTGTSWIALKDCDDT